MFEGSEHHDRGFFQPLQGAGATLNGSTNADRTNYWEVVPTSALELALWMESDRMGYLLPALTRGEILESARRRAQRAPAELREPAVRPRADGDSGGAVSARPSVPLDDDRRDRRPARGAARRSARVLPPLLPSGERVAGPRRRYRSGARRSRSCAPISASIDAGRARRSGARRGVARGRRRGFSSRTASSCRGSTWRGSRPRCSPMATPISISPTDLLANGKTSRLYRRLVFDERIATDVSAVAELARDRRLLPGHRDGRARPHAGRDRGARSSRRSRGSATDGPTDEEIERGRVQAEIAVRVPAADGRRLRRQIRSAERVQRVRRRSGVLRSRPRSGTRSVTPESLRRGGRRAISTRRAA